MNNSHNEEAEKLIALLRQLDFKRTREFYYMVKGAVFAAKEAKE